MAARIYQETINLESQMEYEVSAERTGKGNPYSTACGLHLSKAFCNLEVISQ